LRIVDVGTLDPGSDALADAQRTSARLRGFEEAAGIDDHDVGAAMPTRELVTLCAQPGEDALGIDQRLGAAERYERDFRGRVGHGTCIEREMGSGTSAGARPA